MLHDSDEKQLPSTFGEVIQQLKNTKIPEEIFSEYTDSITLNVRQHIIDTLSPFFIEYNDKMQNLYNLEELTERPAKSGKLILY